MGDGTAGTVIVLEGEGEDGPFPVSFRKVDIDK